VVWCVVLWCGVVYCGVWWCAVCVTFITFNSEYFVHLLSSPPQPPARPECFVAYIGSYISTFWDNLSVSFATASPLKARPICYPETSVCKCSRTQCNVSEERRSLLHRDVSLKSGEFWVVETAVFYGAVKCPVLSFPALSCPVLSCPALPCPALPCPVLSCPVLSVATTERVGFGYV
jgi:hypothetical protein